ncbi:hypothetical protein MYX65_01450 [Acidobacteria bacterium AH-259-L09]|nr:hypothetical protein [Acidobacteria bacterium AH-259-L09]
MYYVYRILLISTFFIFYVPNVWSSCAEREPIKKSIKIDSCEVVVPYDVPRLNDFAERYPKGFVESYRKEAEKTVQDIMESYQGAILIEEQGGNTFKYFLASKDKQVCNKLDNGKLLNVVIDFACCDGDPNPPCYLGLASYVVKVSEAGKK